MFNFEAHVQRILEIGFVTINSNFVHIFPNFQWRWNLCPTNSVHVIQSSFLSTHFPPT